MNRYNYLTNFIKKAIFIFFHHLQLIDKTVVKIY